LDLTPEERSILAGARGEPVRRALEYQIEVGRFWGAQRFVPVTNVHMMGDIEVMGDAGLQYLRDAAMTARSAVPTTTNARCIDFAQCERLGQDPVEVAKERELIQCLRRMDVITTDTCINYQTVYQPHLGEHVAWGDTGTVIYANSVFGARSNFESGPAAVPVFHGFHRSPTADELKHLGAALASYGSMGMFHFVGVTPEAPSLQAALSNRQSAERLAISDGDISNVYKSYGLGDGDARLVVFSGPQQSLLEMKRLAQLFEGKKVKAGSSCFVTTNGAVLAQSRTLGFAPTLEAAGVTILEGVCFYILQNLSPMRVANRWTNMVSNSAKIVNIIGAHRFNTILRRTADCVEIACSGKLR
jgi:predicted aconitase